LTGMDKPTVFVVDDDAAVRDSIAELLESVDLQAECYASATAFLEGFEAERAGCLVLDVRMPGMSGLVLQETLKTLGERIPIIIITGHGDVPMAVEAMRNGAVDFIQKPYREQALLDSINAALLIDAEARQKSQDAAGQFDERLFELTEREIEVLEHLRAGKTSKEIARALGISPRTAEAHRRNLLHKLEFDSVKALLLYLVARNGGGQDPRG